MWHQTQPYGEELDRLCSSSSLVEAHPTLQLSGCVPHNVHQVSDLRLTRLQYCSL